MLETSGDVRENDSSPAEVEQLPDAIPAQGDAVNDGEMYSTNPGSRSDLVSDSDIGLVPESTSCSSAAASVGDKMDIDMESLEQNIDFGHKRAQSLSPNSLNPTPQKRAKSSYRQVDAPTFSFSMQVGAKPPKTSKNIIIAIVIRPSTKPQPERYRNKPIGDCQPKVEGRYDDREAHYQRESTSEL